MCQIIVACVKLGFFPDRDRVQWITPVDFVSHAIVTLSRNPQSLGQAFHLVGHQGVHTKEVLEWIGAAGYPLRCIPGDEWRQKLFAEASRSPRSAHYPLAYVLGAGRSGRDTGGESRTVVRPEFGYANVKAALPEGYGSAFLTDARQFTAMLSGLREKGILTDPPGMAE